VTSGLASGEGLIKAAARQPDRRLLVVEGEFSKTLKVANREGNTLSEVIRLGWDKGDLGVMTKEETKVQGAHISLVGHITQEELVRNLTELDAANGFANRFLFVCARRANRLPEGGSLDDEVIARMGARVGDAIKVARRIGILQRSTAFKEVWSTRYHEMDGDEPGGLLGGLISRGPAQLLRLSTLYAAEEGSHSL